MSRVKRGCRRDSIEQAVELALRLGDFIDYGASWSLVSNLEVVERDIVKLLNAEPERAVDLYETFVAGCYEKAEEIDDSSGNFGMFVQDRFRGWITARQAAGSDAEETAGMLLGWMDNDDYGFCHQLEREAAKVLSKKGLSAFASRIRARFDGVDPTKASEYGRESSYRRRHWGQALRPFTPHSGMWIPTYRYARRQSWSRSTARSWPEYSNPAASPTRRSPGSSVASSSRSKCLRAEGRATSWLT
jgi:hypothetical protein